MADDENIHLEMGVELALFEILRAWAERIHQVATYRGITLDLPGEDGLNV